MWLKLLDVCMMRIVHQKRNILMVDKRSGKGQLLNELVEWQKDWVQSTPGRWPLMGPGCFFHLRVGVWRQLTCDERQLGSVGWIVKDLVLLLLREWQGNVIRVGIVENFGDLGSGKANTWGRVQENGYPLSLLVGAGAAPPLWRTIRQNILNISQAYPTTQQCHVFSRSFPESPHTGAQGGM